MFRTVPLSIIRSYSLYTQQCYMSYRFVDRFRAGSGWVPSWPCCCSKPVYKTVWHIPLLCVQWITPDDGQRKCPKHVEFHFQNKFEKLVSVVGFMVRLCHDARSQVTMHGLMSRCTVSCHDARSHVTMHGLMSRCTVTCHDARSQVTMHGHMNVKLTEETSRSG
jgi:hypothetical protein